MRHVTELRTNFSNSFTSVVSLRSRPIRTKEALFPQKVNLQITLSG